MPAPSHAMYQRAAVENIRYPAPVYRVSFRPELMNPWQRLEILDRYDVALVVLGLAIFAGAVLPRLLWKIPCSAPIALLVLGYGVFSLVPGLPVPDPLIHGALTERLTELVVIVALMGAGLKIDRPFTWRAWSGTWRLLGITMVLSIALAAWLGWWIAGLAPAVALLLGALAAPTDPVLASEIQVGSPRRGSANAEVTKDAGGDATEEDEFRFTLTSEAGLNDGLAFPFVHASILMAAHGAAPGGWIGGWLAHEVVYKLATAAVLGIALGKLLGRLILAIPWKTPAAKAMVGPAALAATLIIHGITEAAGGYGFVATFIGAVAIRSGSRDHDYHESLHLFSEMIERVLTAIVLVAFGGAIAGGVMDSLTWPLALTAVLVVFVVRPVAGVIGLAGFTAASWRERLAIAFFGVRGIGSFYYLAYALNRHPFPGAEAAWAFAAMVVVISIFVHGIAAAPVTLRLDRIREKASA